MSGVPILEWWPDYGIQPVHVRNGPGGTPVDADTLGLPGDLALRITAWGSTYEEDKLPLDGAGDPAWLDTGRGLLGELRTALAGRYDVVTTEPWWEPDGA